MRPRLQAIVGGLLDVAETRDEFDALRELAIPLPVMVIGRMLGLPEADFDRLRAWSDAPGSLFQRPDRCAVDRERDGGDC